MRASTMIIAIILIISGCSNVVVSNNLQTPRTIQPLSTLSLIGDQTDEEEFAPPKHSEAIQSAKPDTPRKNPLKKTNVPELNTTITEPKKVISINQKLIHLSLFPNKLYFCPNDGGITYHFKFSQGKVIVLEAEANVAGCQGIHTSDNEDLWSMEPKGNGFWSLVASTLNLNNKDLRGDPFN
jgi:hypothetical protein